MKKPFFSPPLTGRHVFLMLVVFFGVVIVVNGIFIYQANKSWRGLQSETAYEDGLAYNRTLTEAEAQQALGWQAEMTLTHSRLTLKLSDRAGLALNGLEPRARIGRPADEAYDLDIPLTPAGPGLYQADITLPQAGQWLVQIAAETPAGQPYRLEERFILP